MEKMLQEQHRPLKSFKDLETWKQGHDLVIDVYKITAEFPRKEDFGLTNQLRRAVVSITSNIAEGFSRASYQEKIQFYRISLGSLTEVQNQLTIAKDVGYLASEIFELLEAKTLQVHKLLNGLIKKSRTFIS